MLADAGLWGDGDELEALELIEKRLDVRLQDEDAPMVRTVGDLWDRLLATNPQLKGDRRNWIRLVVALTAFTGLNPRLIGRETLLIVPKKPSLFRRTLALVRSKDRRVQPDA